MPRPLISNIKTGSELKKWYWLKEELISFAKSLKINLSGSKFQIQDRIADFLDGKNIQPNSVAQLGSAWSKTELSLSTLITDGYTNGPNSRQFFKIHCGSKFSFSIPFMQWIKDNKGKTLQDAVNQYFALENLKKDSSYQSIIPESNQYNKYIRDFFDANPNRTLKDARHFWKLKKSLPATRHFYETSDLELK